MIRTEHYSVVAMMGLIFFGLLLTLGCSNSNKVSAEGIESKYAAELAVLSSVADKYSWYKTNGWDYLKIVHNNAALSNAHVVSASVSSNDDAPLEPLVDRLSKLTIRGPQVQLHAGDVFCANGQAHLKSGEVVPVSVYRKTVAIESDLLTLTLVVRNREGGGVRSR